MFCVLIYFHFMDTPKKLFSFCFRRRLLFIRFISKFTVEVLRPNFVCEGISPEEDLLITDSLPYVEHKWIRTKSFCGKDKTRRRILRRKFHWKLTIFKQQKMVLSRAIASIQQMQVRVGFRVCSLILPRDRNQEKCKKKLIQRTQIAQFSARLDLSY